MTPIPKNTRSSKLMNSLSSPTSDRTGLTRNWSLTLRNATERKSGLSADAQNATSRRTAPVPAVMPHSHTSTKTTAPKDNSCAKSAPPGSRRKKANFLPWNCAVRTAETPLFQRKTESISSSINASIPNAPTISITLERWMKQTLRKTTAKININFTTSTVNLWWIFSAWI